MRATSFASSAARRIDSKVRGWAYVRSLSIGERTGFIRCAMCKRSSILTGLFIGWKGTGPAEMRGQKSPRCFADREPQLGARVGKPGHTAAFERDMLRGAPRDSNAAV